MKLISNQKIMFSKLVLMIYVFLFSFAFTACGLRAPHQMPNMPTAEVETIKVSLSDKVREVESAGELISPQTTEVNSEIMGKIIYLNIPEGKEVSAGHVLAKIDNSTTVADIKVAKAKAENARENYKRMQVLKNEGAVSQQTLDNALEQLEVSEGELEKTESLEAKNSIFAPYTGLLSLKQVSLGDFIDSGDSVVRISQVDPLHLIFSLPEQYSSELTINQNVKFTVSGLEKQYTGKISVIDPYIDPDTRAVQVKAVVSNTAKELLPGRSAKVVLELLRISNVVSLPEEVLIQDSGKKQVAVVDENNTVSIKEVTVSYWDKGNVIISSGLMDGDVVITSGYQKVFPGSMVIPKPFNPIHNQNLDKQIPKS